PCLRMTSVLKRPITDSASALSYESPLLPTEFSIPASAKRSVYRMDRYWVDSKGRRNTSTTGRSCDGCEEAAALGPSATTENGFARPTDGGASRASAEVLGRDRSRLADGACGPFGGRVTRCGRTMVSPLW